MDPKEVREKINKLGTDLEALLKKAKDENRDLTKEEGETFDRMDGEREALLVTERRLLKVAEIAQGTGRKTDPVPPSPENRSAGSRGADRDRDRGGSAQTRQRQDESDAFRGWFMGNRRTEAQLAAMQRCHISPDDNRILLALATRPPASLRAEDLRDWEERGYLGVDVISPDTGGHYLRQDELMRALEVALLAFGGMRTVATVTRTDTGSNLPFPTMNDTNNEGAIIGESIEETNEVLPELGQLVLEAYTYSSRKIPVSVEFMQDNAVNFQGRVGELLGERIARITNRHFTIGTGASQPKGLVTAAADSGIVTASATAISYDEIVGLVHSVDPAYRQQRTGPTAARFMFHDQLLLGLKKIKVPQFTGDTAGYPLWKAGMAAGDPDTIDGYQYVINQHMPVPTANQKAAVFGALHKYQIRDVRTIEVQRLNELRAEFRQVLWLAWSRHDGDLLDAGTHPVKYLAMHA